MTCLHWAAYQGDSRLVEVLLNKGAKQSLTTLGNAPVDIAGFCGHSDAVLSFCKFFELGLDAQKAVMAYKTKK